MINDTNTEEATVDAVEEVEATEAPASLTVQDLANLRNIIDVASQRGAFKTNEFTVVGATYTKLANFITAITPAPAEDEAAAEADTAESFEDEAPVTAGE